VRTRSSLAAATLVLALAACGGGGGGGSTGPGPIPTPTPDPRAVASGTVVDGASGAPLPGTLIALQPFVAGASPVTTTAAADGSFTTPPVAAGRYLLVVGADNAGDARATFHFAVTLAAGSNVLTAPAPQAAPDVTYAPAQLSGAFRLAALSADELGCLAGANAGRKQLGLRALVSDELLLEDARAVLQEEAAQSTDTPAPLFANPPAAQYVFGGLNAPMHTEQDFPQCAVWTGPGYSYDPNQPPYKQAADPAEIWYGAAFAPARAGDPHASYGAQLWLPDPRS
jgi:hypothetical protein